MVVFLVMFIDLIIYEALRRLVCFVKCRHIYGTLHVVTPRVFRIHVRTCIPCTCIIVDTALDVVCRPACCVVCVFRC